MNAVAGIAIALGKALSPQFKGYAAQVITNAAALARALIEGGARLVTGGTENHMMVVDTVSSFGIDGTVAEGALDRAGITVNKQIIPDDPKPPLRPSGIRLGTPAATTRGMSESDMQKLAEWIVAALQRAADAQFLDSLRLEVESFCARFPVPGIAAGAEAH